MQALPALGSPGAHRPAACASPSSARLSRRRAASSRSSPGMRASVAAAAVCRRTVARPKARSSGPAVDVDELHPPVRHDRQAGEHHTAPDEQVFLPLRVAPRAEVLSDEPRQEGLRR